MDAFSALRLRLNALVAAYINSGDEGCLDQIPSVVNAIPLNRLRNKLLGSLTHVEADQVLIDARHEAIAQLCSRLRRYPEVKPPKDPISWAYRTIDNFTKRWFRASEAARRELFHPVADDVLSLLAAGTLDTAYKEIRDSVMTCFRLLEPACQKLLYLIHYANFTPQAIASNADLAVELFSKQHVAGNTVRNRRKKCEGHLREFVLGRAA